MAKERRSTRSFTLNPTAGFPDRFRRTRRTPLYFPGPRPGRMDCHFDFPSGNTSHFPPKLIDTTSARQPIAVESHCFAELSSRSRAARSDRQFCPPVPISPSRLFPIPWPRPQTQFHATNTGFPAARRPGFTPRNRVIGVEVVLTWPEGSRREVAVCTPSPAFGIEVETTVDDGDARAPLDSMRGDELPCLKHIGLVSRGAEIRVGLVRERVVESGWWPRVRLTPFWSRRARPGRPGPSDKRSHVRRETRLPSRQEHMQMSACPRRTKTSSGR